MKYDQFKRSLNSWGGMTLERKAAERSAWVDHENLSHGPGSRDEGLVLSQQRVVKVVELLVFDSGQQGGGAGPADGLVKFNPDRFRRLGQSGAQCFEECFLSGPDSQELDRAGGVIQWQGSDFVQMTESGLAFPQVLSPVEVLQINTYRTVAAQRDDAGIGRVREIEVESVVRRLQARLSESREHEWHLRRGELELFA